VRGRFPRRTLPVVPIDFDRSPNHHAPMIAPILQVAARWRHRRRSALSHRDRPCPALRAYRLSARRADRQCLGSFAMGLFVGLAAHRGLTHLSPFVATGILGGFTTFSAFSLEAVTLYERGALGLAAVYVIGNVSCPSPRCSRASRCRGVSRHERGSDRHRRGRGGRPAPRPLAQAPLSAADAGPDREGLPQGRDPRRRGPREARDTRGDRPIGPRPAPAGRKGPAAGPAAASAMRMPR
jgi:hypothetical protein